MIQTNISFEVCSLFILVIVFVHMNMRNQVKNFRNNFFILFTICGVIDVILDIMTSVMLDNPLAFSKEVRTVSLEIFYLFQLLLPYLLYLYILALRNALNKKGIIQIALSSMVTFTMSILAVTNAATGLYFQFMPNNERIFGPLYIGLYVYAIVYLLVIMLDAIIHRKKIKQHYYIVVLEFVLISGAAVVLQLIFPNILLTGVGISFSIIILMITVQNPNNVQDYLTGVFSLEGMQTAIKEYELSSRPYGMIVVALDNLKRINYIFGIEYGDELLRNVAEELKQIANKENVFRFLGDQFVLLLSDEKEYQNAYEKVVTLSEKTVRIHSTEVSVTSCICAFPVAEDYGTVAEVSSFIEFSVEAAKAIGVGTVLPVDQSMHDKYNCRRLIEGYLIKAINEKLFDVHYQPIYSVDEDRFTCMEALVRLTHPVLGKISPAEFIPIAEKSGLVSKIDHLAFQKVCRFISSHPEILVKMPNVKFNISPADLMDVSFPDRIEEVLKHYELDPSIFQFEITETTATLYTEQVRSWSERIQKMNAELCLDDFGSGYANLDTVMIFPYSIIKIDRSMLLSGMESKKGSELYEGIVILLRMLGFHIVAEGAETEEQVQFLRKLQVNYIQGYYFSKPMPEAEILNFIKQ